MMGTAMPERLYLPQDWLIENMRSAVKSYKHLLVNSEQVVSEQELDSFIELAASGLVKEAAAA
jgi:uncharacterized protein with von Willebrand factor type A (vWA) domain